MILKLFPPLLLSAGLCSGIYQCLWSSPRRCTTSKWEHSGCIFESTGRRCQNIQVRCRKACWVGEGLVRVFWCQARPKWHRGKTSPNPFTLTDTRDDPYNSWRPASIERIWADNIYGSCLHFLPVSWQSDSCIPGSSTSSWICMGGGMPFCIYLILLALKETLSRKAKFAFKPQKPI